MLMEIFAHLSDFGDFMWYIWSLWLVYFGDVWFISAATVENFYICMLFDIYWRRSVYFLNICVIHVYYRFNRNRALQVAMSIYLFVHWLTSILIWCSLAEEIFFALIFVVELWTSSLARLVLGEMFFQYQYMFHFALLKIICSV